jgi:hypothetical protein
MFGVPNRQWSSVTHLLERTLLKGAGCSPL